MKPQRLCRALWDSLCYHFHILPAYLLPFVHIPSLALCRNPRSDSIELKSIRTHCWGQMSSFLTPLTHSQIQTRPVRAELASMIFLEGGGLLMNMQDVSYLSSSLPNPPFLNSSWPPLLFFMMCSQGERPATPLSWVALNEEKKRGRKILPGPFPNEQINASVLQEMREGEKDRDAIGTPRPRPKHSHRSSYHMLWMGPFLT